MPKPASLTEPPRHALIVRTDHLGDMLLTLPAVRGLKATYPGCRVTVLASAANAEAARHDPDVDAVEVDPFEASQVRVRGVWRLARRIRDLGCDTAIVVRPTFRVALAVYLARVPVRIGTAYRGYSVLFNRRVRHHRRHASGHESQHNIALLEPLGIPPTVIARVTWNVGADERAETDALLARHAAQDARLAVVHPGNAGSGLNWAPRQYGELSGRLAAHGLRVVVTGGAGEIGLTNDVARLAGEAAIDLGGQLSVRQLAALIARSSVYIGSATGPTHLAAAVGARVVALHSPIRSARPERWRPLGADVVILQPPVGVVCAKCLGADCPYYHCMERHIAVDEVEHAALRLVEGAAAGPCRPSDREGPV